MAEWLKALVSKTGIPFTGYRGFESPFFRKRGNGTAVFAAVLFCPRSDATAWHRSEHFPKDAAVLGASFGHFPKDEEISGTTFGHFPKDAGVLSSTFGHFPKDTGVLGTTFGIFPKDAAEAAEEG